MDDPHSLVERSAAMRFLPRTVPLVTRVLLAIVIAGLLPFTGVALIALRGYHAASIGAERTTANALDDASSAALRQRTQQTASALGSFLDERADDTRMVALLPPDPAIIAHFAARTQPLWYVTGTPAQPEEHHDSFPLYRELLAVDRTGRVIVRVADGKVASDLGDVARASTYLATARTLAPDALSVSHLSRLYTPEPADQSERLPGDGYLSFDGVYRFIAARRLADGTFDGAVMLALDARFVMEFTAHIVSTQADRAVVWSDFASGDYSYVLDDEGFAIAHPQLWAVRGDDADGHPVPAAGSPAELRDHPLSDALGGWIDPNRPVLFANGLAGKPGSLTATNTAGTVTLKTYAPVPFAEGSYRERGVFGVVVIGASLAEFHQPASGVSAIIDRERGSFSSEMGWVACVGLLLSVLAGILISRMLVRPLRALTAVAEKLKQGVLDEEPLIAIRKRRFADEVTVLADVFADMGRQVVRREQQLRTEITELHIHIDSRRRQEQAAEIIETDYFRDLRTTASRLRALRDRGPTGAEAASTDATPHDPDAPSIPTS
jgi:HAMP domain-containing protein